MKFIVDSGKLIVSDPCYELGTWCAAQVDVCNGVWNVEVEIFDNIRTEGWGNRIARLIITHESHDEIKHSLILQNSDIGVDSGQAGFFCSSIYPAKRTESAMDFKNPKTFYDLCCNKTLYPEENGCCNYGIVMDKGVVSSSGFGDGGYELNVWGDFAKNQGTKLELIFIDESGEEE